LLAAAQFWAMHRQADYMRRGLRISIRQTRIAVRNASAARIAADAANSSANTAKRSLELVERADIFISETSTDAVLVVFKSYVTVKLKNFGRTSADRIKINTSLSIPRLPNPPHVIFTGSSPESAIAAGDEVKIQFGPIKTQKDIIDEVTQGQAKLLFGIDILYSDIFDSVHATTCEGTFVPNDGTFTLKILTHS